ncbi:hypothetical protein ZWY2020_037329 [Hordeum vulgare]|nr:hypothetical protein ZWY2020_037329 [Hordeum vulgare]
MSGAGSSSGVVAEKSVADGWLPLIQCPDCKIHKIWQFESNTENHPGWILYKCVNHKVGENPCNFLHWEYSYIDYVKLHGHLSCESLDSEVVERKIKKNKV